MVGGRDMDKGANFELEMELVFHNEPYFFTMTVTPTDNLSVQVERKHDGMLWRGEFTARYIEGITQKTGSFKKFAVFVSMLRSAVLQESDSVFVELLSYQDLEMLKHKKSTEPGQAPVVANNKRYLILTYDGEFDRVHYPLPLMFEEHPDVEALTRTVKRQRAEIAHLKVQLRTREKFPASHKRVESDAFEGPHPTHPKCADARNNDERQKVMRELSTYKKKCQMLISELQEKKNYAKDMQAMRKRVLALQEDMKAERLNHKHAILHITKEKMCLQDELKIAKIAERRLHGQIRDKEHALDILKRQLRVDPDAALSPRKPDWVSCSRSPPLTRSTSPQPADWPPQNSRRPSPYASRLHTPPRPFLTNRGHPERSRSAFSTRTNSPRSAGTSKVPQERSKSAFSSRTLTPQNRSMSRTNTPTSMSIRMNSPRSGSTRANSPRNGSTRTNSPRDDYFRYTSPPPFVERYHPHSSRSSRPTSAFSTSDISPRDASFRHCSLPVARGKSPASRALSPYDAYLTANGLGSASSGTRPVSRDSAFHTPNAHSSARRPSSRDSLSPRVRTPAEQSRTHYVSAELKSGKASPRIPPRANSREGSESRQGYRPQNGVTGNSGAKDQLTSKKTAEDLATAVDVVIQSAERPTSNTRPPAASAAPKQHGLDLDLKQQSPAPCHGTASPRQVLQEVEERLANFAKKEKESSQLSVGKSSEVPIPEEEKIMGMQILEQKQPTNHVTRGTAVLDVDSRLHALQNFLQAAKASMKEEAYDFII